MPLGLVIIEGQRLDSLELGLGMRPRKSGLQPRCGRNIGSGGRTRGMSQLGFGFV